ncbi:MAG: type IV pilus secretin PilQ [Desulforegulaceae bacterium]|nr:type IV pilus secretin PilQ [Desulforegulaceae bacterium]
MNFIRRTNGSYIKIILALLFVVLILFGCSSKKDSGTEPGTDDRAVESSVSNEDVEKKNIVSVFAEVQNGLTYINIIGDSELIYSAVKEKEPDAIVLYFPDTFFNSDLSSRTYSEGALKNIEFKQEENDAKIRFFIESDLPYEVTKEGYNLIVKIDSSIETKTDDSVSAEEKSPEVVEKVEVAPETSYAEASRFEDIEFFEEKEFFKIKILADGAIKKYNSFTLNNPPRIVFDLVNISSPYTNVQKLDLNNKWAKSLRHYANSSRLRLVIDSRGKWLNNYGSQETKDGLEIFIGKRDENNILKAESEPVEYEASSVIVSNNNDKDASLKSLDFSALEDGRSKVIIETSTKVEYKAEKPEADKLAIKLFNTKIPDYHQRPIITTRFDSAVNRIFPVYNQLVNKNDSLIYIDLRENVAFKINDEIDNIIEIEFDPSAKSILEEAEFKAPEWKHILSDGRAVSDSDLVAQSSTVEKKENISKAVPINSKEESTQETFFEDSKDPLIDYKEKKYTGQPIILDFYETNIKNVFKIIQHVSGLNFAIDKDVSGNVTMTLKQPVPWDQVLDLVLKMNSLGMQKEGNIVRIAQLSTIQAEEQRKKDILKARQESQNQEKNVAPLFTEYLLINYSDAQSEILPHLQKVLSERGSLSVDKRNNQVILTDTMENIEKCKEIISRIDKITPQVVIEARIVEANSDFSKDIGTEWQASSNVADASPYASIRKDVLGGNYGYNVAMNTPQQSGSIGVNFARITGTPFILNAKLNAMETQKKGKIISAPKVVTLDNKKATIKQGYEYPYTTLEDGETKTEFKQIDLQLEVTPHVTADNKISMKVNIDKNDVYVDTPDGPALSTKNVQTELLVNDGDTIVIGGIIQQSETLTENSFPLLSKIPLLGWFFKSRENAKTKQELLVFLTPRIVELEQGKF